MLEFQHVTFQYDSEDFNIIDDLSFTVEPEEFISIIGISGCGKEYDLQADQRPFEKEKRQYPSERAGYCFRETCCRLYAPEGSALSMAHH